MRSHEALLSGLSIGLTIAAPIGPMALIVIRRTLAGGFLVGMSTGAGASTAHLIYASLAVFGIHRVESLIEGNRAVLAWSSVSILLFFAVRMLLPRSGGTKSSGVTGRSMIANYASAVEFNLVNPMGAALMLGAVLAIAGLASIGGAGTGILAAGVFLGSIGWWTCLVSATTAVGYRVSETWVRAIDVLAGLAMLALAVSTMSRMN